VLLAAVCITACIVTDGGGVPLPSDTIRVAVELPPGSTETYEFVFEAEATSSGERFSVHMSPSAATLAAQAVTIEQSWMHGDTEAVGWPVQQDVGAGERFVGNLRLTLTNQSQDGVVFDLEVTITADSITLPGPTDETFFLDLRLP